MRSSSPAQRSELAPGCLIAGRYRVELCLGHGGMGEVYRVLDERAGRCVALKRRAPSLLADQSTLAFQFEREYYTLCELAHPRIIEVYDFGVSDAGAYYTMELLDGQDLRERGKLPWREACLLLADVASSLAILHSRGFLHRDVSPRNVRCTADGRAKLIDFGAMMPIGPAKNIVGTPPFIPPEALQKQSLDARADLFALGALAYLILTGRHAFPARAVHELRDAWMEPPASVARLTPDVPAALDELVLGLLHLNRDARSATAAEVIERLAGIAGLARDDRIEVTRAYLVTPPLIGRRLQLERVRAQLIDGMRGQGGACLVIDGAPGTGRSRFLDACVLEAKLLGATVLRADSADGAAGEYGALRSLCQQLLNELPQLGAASAGPRRAVLSFVAPELGPESVANTPEPAILNAAVRDWISTISRSKPIVIAIDDADAIDASSAAWLATLALRSERRGLTLLLSMASDTPPTNASALIQTVAQRVSLERFDSTQTEALIRGVFGVEQVAGVAQRIHQLAEGSPRETMALLEWLVERGTARYEAGSWTLPVDLQAHDLPASLTAAWVARMEALPADARELGAVLSLTDIHVLRVEDYVELTSHQSTARTNRALDVLVAAGVLVVNGELHYRFRQTEYPSLLSERVEPEQRRVLHARIASVLERYTKPFLSAHHMLSAGQDQAAIDKLSRIEFGSRTEHTTWMMAIAQRAVEAGERLGVPPRVDIQLRLGMLTFVLILADHELFNRYALPLLARFKRDSGLDDYEALDPTRPAGDRLFEALTAIQRRYDATPEAERGFTPIENIRYLALTCAGFVNMASVAQSLELIEMLPSLEPLVALSPALGVSQRLIDGMRAFQSGRYEDARLAYLHVLERVEQPDHAGLEPTVHRSIVLGVKYFHAVISTIRGIPSAPEWLVELENEPGMRVNAWRVHMASELMQGNYAAAALCQRRSELALAQDGQQLRYRGTTVRLELLAYARAMDLLGVKRTMERIEPVARRHPRWEVDLCLARYHYQHLSGDDTAALAALLPALDMIAPGRHVNWAITVATHVRALCAVGRYAEAAERGFEYIEQHEAAALSGTICELTQALADALLHDGRLEQAAHYADRCIREALELGSRGVFLGVRYETRARIALAMNDLPTFQTMAGHCAREYNPGNSTALTALYERLMRDGGRPATLRRRGTPESDDASQANAIRARLAACVSAQERANLALQLLIELSGARAGYLLGLRQGQLEVLTLEGCAHNPPAAMVDVLQSYLAWNLSSELATDSEETAEHRDPRAWLDPEGRRFSPLLLTGERQTERAFAAVAALHYAESPPRALDPALVEIIASALLEQTDLDDVTIVI